MDNTVQTMTAYGAAALVGFGAGLAVARHLTRADQHRPRTRHPKDPSAPSVVYLTGYMRGFADGGVRTDT